MTLSEEKYINPLTDFGFKKLFGTEPKIGRFSPAEREAYEESLKYYRDIKNVVDTSIEMGVKKVAFSVREIAEMTGFEEKISKL